VRKYPEPFTVNMKELIERLDRAGFKIVPMPQERIDQAAKNLADFIDQEVLWEAGNKVASDSEVVNTLTLIVTIMGFTLHLAC
jgi:phage terminase large subunit-like protein